MRVRKSVLGAVGLVALTGVVVGVSQRGTSATPPTAERTLGTSVDAEAAVPVGPVASLTAIDLARPEPTTSAQSDDSGRAVAVSLAEDLTTYEADGRQGSHAIGRALTAYHGDAPRTWVVVVRQRITTATTTRLLTVAVRVLVERTPAGWRAMPVPREHR